MHYCYVYLLLFESNEMSLTYVILRLCTFWTELIRLLSLKQPQIPRMGIIHFKFQQNRDRSAIYPSRHIFIKWNTTTLDLLSWISLSISNKKTTSKKHLLWLKNTFLLEQSISRQHCKRHLALLRCCRVQVVLIRTTWARFMDFALAEHQ